MAIEETHRPAGSGPVVGGHDAVCTCRVDTVPASPSDILVLRVAGEIDLSSQHVLGAALAACLHRAPGYFLVDLSAVTFCGARGLCLLDIAAAAHATAGPARFALTGLTPLLNRVAGLLWASDRPVRYPSLAAAVTAMRTEQVHRVHPGRQESTSDLPRFPPAEM